MQGKGLFTLVGAIFSIVGVILLSVAGWSGNRQYTILKTWPTGEAEVTKSEVVSYRDSEGSTMYRAAIDFRYSVNGKDYTAAPSSSYSSSSYNSIKKDVDSAFRYGGDEFAVILPYATPIESLMVSRRIRENLRMRIDDVGISIGTASRGETTNFEEMVDAADKDMYSNKGSKKTTRPVHGVKS